MNFRLTAILFGAVLVGVIALLIATFTGETDPGTDVLLTELVAVKDKPDQIDAVEIEQDTGTKLRLNRVGADRWEVEWAPAGGAAVKAKADPDAVREVVAALLKAKPTAYEKLSSDPAVHGLQPPSLKVTLRQGERAGTINFGNTTVTGGDKAVVFVTTSARPNRPMAVQRAAVGPLFRSAGGGTAAEAVKWAPEFRSKQVFPAGARGDDAAAVALAARGKTLALERGPKGWRFTTPAGWGEADVQGAVPAAPGTFTGVRPLLQALTGLQALAPADFVDNPTPEQLAQYGLDPGNPDAVRVELTAKDGEKAVAYIGKADPAAPGKVWVRVEGQPGVIRANAGDLAGLVPLIENPDPLRDRTLLALDRSRIDGIDLSAGGQAVTLRKVGPDWKLFGNPAAGDPQPAVGVDALLNLLTERRTITGFPPADDANFPTRLAQVSLWADAFAPPDPKADPKAEPRVKPDAKPTQLIFGRREGDQVYVRRVLPDGSAADFKVPEKVKVGGAEDPTDLVAALTKSRLDYLSRDLKGFAATNANRLTATGAANFDLEKDEKKDASAGDDRWVYAAPPGQKGQTVDARAVEGMLDILATTPTATRIVDEAPTPGKLAEYGLSPAPRLKVVVGLKDAPAEDKERVYEFGKETGDPNFVYARQGGRDAVFTLPRFVFEKFTTADLRDKAIFRFDPARVTNLKLTGWGASGFPGTLAFAKNKDGVWEKAEGPPDFVADPNKVNDFLRALSRARVRAFVPGPVTAEHGFGDPKHYLIAEVTTPDGLVSVNLGAPADGGAAYYGWTNLLPATAPVFTVDAGPFKAFKESAKAFAR